ncbi:hypothetical protein BV898_13470 [Hypsibius exemplaris]|uniref:Uncharacterized protein n=1 Tax=Hypsibius exemplaris TaxID=2072580 RepID=A0A1W0WAS7_HYPEX|nr:hypothetical protein BV898_13470 [Hypsibius exemplaris]
MPSKLVVTRSLWAVLIINGCVVRSEDFAVTEANPHAPSEERNLTVCWILESDSYYSSHARLAGAVDLAIHNANTYIMPDGWRLQLAFQSAGPSCSDTQFSVTTNVLRLLQTGVSCDVFLGAGKG